MNRNAGPRMWMRWQVLECENGGVVGSRACLGCLLRDGCELYLERSTVPAELCVLRCMRCACLLCCAALTCLRDLRADT